MNVLCMNKLVLNQATEVPWIWGRDRGRMIWFKCQHICDRPSMHKPNIHRKTSKSRFLHHPLTELLLITMMFFFFPYDLLFSSYTTVSMIQPKIYISRNVRFRFRICTLFTNSPTTNRFVFDESILSSWTKLFQEVSSRG